jgi:GLPGLI family protein
MQTYKHLYALALILLLGSLSLPVMAQRPLKGRIIYKISYPGSNVDLAELQQLPDKAVVFTKKNQVRTELSGQTAGLYQVKISDADSKNISTLMEIQKEKYVIKRSFPEIQNALRNMPQPEFEFTNDTKMIMGYTCKKAIARVTDMFGVEHQSIIYYTTEIPGAAFNFDNPYTEIPGLMLEYEIRVGQLNIRYEAQSLKKKVFVANRRFDVPRDYQLITYDELRARLQGNL